MDAWPSRPAEPKQTDGQHHRAYHGGAEESLHDIAEGLLLVEPTEEQDEPDVSGDGTESNANEC